MAVRSTKREKLCQCVRLLATSSQSSPRSQANIMRLLLILLFTSISQVLAFNWQLTSSSCDKITYTLYLIVEEVQQATTVTISFLNGPANKISFPIRDFFSSSKLSDSITTIFGEPLTQSYPDAQAIVGIYGANGMLIIYPEGTASDTETFSAPLICSGSGPTTVTTASSSTTTTTSINSTPAADSTTTLPASSPPVPVPTSSNVYTGACSCTVNKCEHTLYVDGCDGQLSYGQSTAAFCSVGSSGNQQIFESYSDFVYNQHATDGCQASSSITDYCTCTPYQGSDFGNLTVQPYTKNAQGYPTSTDYYGGVGQAGNACYCDFQAYANPNPYGDIGGATLVGYFSLGTNEQPVYCTGDGIYAQKGDSQIIAGCGYGNPSTYDTLCHCSPSSAAVTGQYPNLTVAQTAPSPNQSLINLIAAQIKAKDAGPSGSNSGKESSTGSPGRITDGVVTQKLAWGMILTSAFVTVTTTVTMLT